MAHPPQTMVQPSDNITTKRVRPSGGNSAAIRPPSNSTMPHNAAAHLEANPRGRAVPHRLGLVEALDNMRAVLGPPGGHRTLVQSGARGLQRPRRRGGPRKPALINRQCTLEGRCTPVCADDTDAGTGQPSLRPETNRSDRLPCRRQRSYGGMLGVRRRTEFLVNLADLAQQLQVPLPNLEVRLARRGIGVLGEEGTCTPPRARWGTI
jgi:hypothetical protein